MFDIGSQLFAPLSFVERLSQAAREPVYSAAFAWLLDDHSPLALNVRLSIIEQISGETFADVQSIIAETEWENLDLLLTLTGPSGSTFVGVENKIKATDHERQLAAYDEKMQRLPGRAIKLFITLAGERPRSGTGWRAVSYKDLARAIGAQPGADHPLVADLHTAVVRLSHVPSSTLADPMLVQMAYGDPADEQPSDGIAEYVTRLKLTKVVQRIWMAELADRLLISPPWQTWIDESNGQALLDVRALVGGEQPVLIGVQIQGRALKLYSSPYPYPKRATAEQHQSVQIALERIIERTGISRGQRMSRTGDRGFRSVTVQRMPSGREVDRWAAVAADWMSRMRIAFPNVEAIPSVGEQ